MLGINRLFVADHEEGGFDGFLLAPIDRTALLVAKALGAVRLPRGGRGRRGARVRAAAARPVAVDRRRCAQLAVVLVAGRRRHRARRHAGRRDRGPDPRARPDRAAARAALLIPVVIGAARGHGAAARDGRSQRRSQVRWLLVLGLYDLVFGLLAYAVFDFLLED